MENKEKSKLLEESILEVKEILKAADSAAKEKIAKELPEKFNSLLESELKKRTEKESVNESIKNDTKEELEESNETDKNKESLNEAEEEIDMRELSFEDVEEAFDMAEASDEFEVSDEEINLDDIEKELGEMEEMVDEMEEEVHNEGDVHEAENDESDPFELKIRKMQEMLDEMVNEMDSAKKHKMHSEEFDAKMKEMYGESYKDMLGEEKCNELYETYVEAKNMQEGSHDMDEMHEKGPDSGTIEKMHKGDLSPETIKEDEMEEGDHEEREDEVDEGNMTLSHNKTKAGEYTPRPDYREYKKHRMRYALRNENREKRMTSLIEENKKLTKQLNETKSELNELNESMGKHKNILVKYRGQLEEMAIFNTNLAHTNALLVNEELALTSEDKLKIVETFKDIDTITESKEKFTSLLNEMKESKKTISESVEKKMDDGIDSSSSKEIVEKVSEKTAFELNEHINKIKGIMSYVDKQNRK